MSKRAKRDPYAHVPLKSTGELVSMVFWGLAVAVGCLLAGIGMWSLADVAATTGASSSTLRPVATAARKLLGREGSAVVLRGAAALFWLGAAALALYAVPSELLLQYKLRARVAQRAAGRAASGRGEPEGDS